MADLDRAAISACNFGNDLKEAKFARVEASGIASVIDSIAAANKDAPGAGAAMLDDLYELFRRKRDAPHPAYERNSVHSYF